MKTLQIYIVRQPLLIDNVTLIYTILVAAISKEVALKGIINKYPKFHNLLEINHLHLIDGLVESYNKEYKEIYLSVD